MIKDIHSIINIFKAEYFLSIEFILFGINQFHLIQKLIVAVHGYIPPSYIYLPRCSHPIRKCLKAPATIQPPNNQQTVHSSVHQHKQKKKQSTQSTALGFLYRNFRKENLYLVSIKKCSCSIVNVVRKNRSQCLEIQSIDI